MSGASPPVCSSSPSGSTEADNSRLAEDTVDRIKQSLDPNAVLPKLEPNEPSSNPALTRPKDEIKDFAQTTINELLGWYGYDKSANNEDTEQLDLRWTSQSKLPPKVIKRKVSTLKPESKMAEKAADDKDNSSDVSIGSVDSAHNYSSDEERQDVRHDEHQDVRHDERQDVRQDARSCGAMCQGQRTTSVCDDNDITDAECSWCKKKGGNLFTASSPSPSGTSPSNKPTRKAYCSDVCFTLSRRASFKQNKVCDWCKEVRPSVTYVDLQDGDQQLQFCCNKCLNQYKMNIFCQETEEHLRQLQQESSAQDGDDKVVKPSVTNPAPDFTSPAGQILITPDLWAEHKLPETVAVKQERPESPDDTPHTKLREEELVKSPMTQAQGGQNYAQRRNGVPPVYGASRRKSASGKAPQRVVSSSNSRSPGLCSTDGESRSKRDRSADSSSSTPLSILSPSPASLQSTPKSNQHVLGSFAANGFTTLAPNQSVPSVSMGTNGNATSSNISSNPLLYNPLFPAGLGGVLPGLAPHPATALAGFGSQLASGTMTSVPGLDRLLSSTSALFPHMASGLPHPLLPSAAAAVNPLVANVIGNLNNSSGSSVTGIQAPPPPVPPLIPPPPLSSLSQSHLMPPNTVMVPYPVLFPLPVPVPLPFPVPPKAMEEFRESLGCVKKENKDSASEADGATISRKSSTERSSPAPGVPCKQDGACDQGTITCACCVGESSTRDSSNDDPNNFNDLCRRSLRSGSSEIKSDASGYDIHHGAIDLSAKDRRVHSSFDDSSKTQRNGPSSLMKHSPHLPHTLSSLPTYPLQNPTDSGYSARRSRILDAPSMPHDRKRSPSPSLGDKRYYYNLPGRDVYGKRRCIRARVKTK